MDEREERLAKAEALRAAGIDPYPARSARDHTAAAQRYRQHEDNGEFLFPPRICKA